MRKLLLLFTLLLFTLIGKTQVGPVMNICVVTVDSTLTHNVVVWERNSQVGTIDSVAIYTRVPGVGNWIEIDRVDFDSISEYHDYSADPNLRAYGYRIAGIDLTGNMGPLSLPHFTMHISVIDLGAQQTRLIWTPYIGYDSTVFNSYQCWSDSINQGVWGLDFSTANGQMSDTAWTDANTPLDWTNLFYKVDIDWNVSCTATRANNHNTSRSNKTQPAAGTGIHEETLKEFYVYPNPSKGNLNIAFSSLSFLENDIRIFDITGKTVYQKSGIKVMGQFIHTLDVSDYTSGVYFIQVQNEKGEKLSKKLIID